MVIEVESSTSGRSPTVGHRRQMGGRVEPLEKRSPHPTAVSTHFVRVFGSGGVGIFLFGELDPHPSFMSRSPRVFGSRRPGFLGRVDARGVS